MNHLKTFALLAAMTALFVGAGYMVGGASGMVIALVLAGAMNLVSYWNADKIVLRMYGAQVVDETHPHALVRDYVRDTYDLADRAGMPRPKVTVIESEQPNAFATGRNPQNAAVAATTGLLSMLDRDEVRGVMAHELAHVKNRDTLTMTVTATIAGAIGALANFAMFFGGRDEEGRPTGMVAGLVLMIVGPLAAGLVQMAISRSREYEADRVGAEIAGDPQSLARALQKIEAYARGGAHNHAAERNPATAHMFIINPLAGGGADNLFSTHPATHNRVAALMRLAGGGAASAAPAAGFRPRASGTAVPTTGRTSVPTSGPKGPWGR